VVKPGSTSTQAIEERRKEMRDALEARLTRYGRDLGR